MPTLIDRLLSLRNMILESTRHNSAFGKWAVTSIHFKKLISVCSQIDYALMEIDVIHSQKRKLYHVPQEESFFISAKEEFIAAIHAMHFDNCFHIQRFLEAHQNFRFFLEYNIEFLEEINKDFKTHLADKEKNPNSYIWDVVESLESLSQSSHASFSARLLEERLETFKKELGEIILIKESEEAKKNFYYRYKDFKSNRLNILREQFLISENFKKELMSSKNIS